MKKLLLSLVALFTITLASAQTSPTYTAVGTTGNTNYSTYSALVLATKADVKVYGTDSIWVDNWCGVEGYGICVVLDSEGHVSELKTVVNGVSRSRGSSSNYMYAYTGLDQLVDYGAYIPSYYNYYYITAYPGSLDDKSGYIEIWGTAYTSSDATSSPYYYLGWGSYEDTTVAINSVTAPSDATDAPVYNMAGQRVSANTTGLVIKNGKKYFVK